GLPAPAGPEPVDLRARLAERAVRLGIPPEHVTRSEFCTRCGSPPFFSHRAGERGRQFAGLALRPGAAAAWEQRWRGGTGPAAPSTRDCAPAARMYGSSGAGAALCSTSACVRPPTPRSRVTRGCPCWRVGATSRPRPDPTWRKTRPEWPRPALHPAPASVIFVTVLVATGW